MPGLGHRTCGYAYYTRCFNGRFTVCTAGEVGEVELHLVPAVVQAHGHAAHKGLHSCRRLMGVYNTDILAVTIVLPESWMHGSGA